MGKRMYLELRRRKFYACHDLPPDVREAFRQPDKKPPRRLVRSLDTSDYTVAKARAASLEAQWRADIARARGGNGLEADAEWWRRRYLDAKTDDERAAVREQIEAGADLIYLTSLRDDDPAEVRAKQDRFLGLATGKLVKLDLHLEEYLDTLAGRNEKKSVAMKGATIRKFVAGLPYCADVTRKALQEWINRAAGEGAAPATIRRAMSELRGYWRYLVSVQAVADDPDPLSKLVIPGNGKKRAKAEERKPFLPADVVRLLHEARRKDQQVAELIELGMWTGARLEELAALSVERVNLDRRYIEISDAKSAAGWRQVPVHKNLLPTLRQLVNDSKDGYILSGLNANRFGDRGDALGKRFGRLKRALGFGDQFVFHSIRKTVATLLEDAGVGENVAADILGHEKPTMTYGLYSGGTSLAVKAKAIAKLRYPAADDGR
jgi:integrase